jgi:hypothetical protein
MEKSDLKERIAQLQTQLEQLKMEAQEGYAETVIKAKPFLVAEKASTTISTRVKLYLMPNLAEYGPPYSKVRDEQIDLSKIEKTDLDAGILISAEKSWFVYEMMMLPTTDDSLRVFNVKALECSIANPLKNQWKKISLTVKKNADHEFLLVFYKRNMAHVLCFQAICDFLNGKPDKNDVFHLICDSDGPSQFTILRRVEPVRFV